ncbi:MAG: histidinol-phosphatase HisJ family protein [Lachnospiraceae bacterium]|nr:histidinol-phosphatase HisJ family protein [Lachnospiraceae bacterium]
MITADFHMHSAHSEDSDSPMEQQIEAAVAAGLKCICFTEHMDKDWPKDDGIKKGGAPADKALFELDTETYYKHCMECRDKFRDRIDIRFGVEYGFQPHLTEHNRAYASKYPFDFIIGSQHLMNGADVYYPENFAELSDREAFRAYFENELESICLFDGYDVFGHPDYIVRYGTNKNKDYHYNDHADVIDEILRQLIKRGKGIEINTAGFRKLGNEPNPSTEILRRYRELGGEIITVGSDAHTPGSVAYDFDRAEKLLLELGYTYYCIFKDRKPEFISLLK